MIDEGLLTPEEVIKAVEARIDPLLKRIKHLEKLLESRTRRVVVPHAAKATSIQYALCNFKGSLVIPPAEAVRYWTRLAEITHQKPGAVMAANIENAKTAVAWLEKFIETGAIPRT